MLKELNFIHFSFPKGGHYVNFGDFAYLLFCEYSVIRDFFLFFTLRNLSLTNEKMSFTLKDYLQKIWIINFRYLWVSLADFEWFKVIATGFGWFWLILASFDWLWLVLGGCGWFWMILADFCYLQLIFDGSDWLCILYLTSHDSGYYKALLAMIFFRHLKRKLLE